jgi:hypothetical protein
MSNAFLNIVTAGHLAPSPVCEGSMHKSKHYQPAEAAREGPRLRHVISFIETEAQMHPGNRNKRVKVAYRLNCGVSGIKPKNKKAASTTSDFQ